ncbi:hypothetical protein OYC37_26150, partial [Escherichia coli]|nr:hypothetical protein [Escherichia coli]
DYSPADKPWDEHRSISDDVGGIYLRAAGFERYGERVEYDPNVDIRVVKSRKPKDGESLPCSVVDQLRGVVV